MLPDRIFYPVMIAVIGAILAFAFTRGGTVPVNVDDIRKLGFTAQGQGLSVLEPAPGTTYTLIQGDAEEGVYAVLIANQSRATAPPSAGVFVTLNSDFEREFAGQDIEVIVTARQGKENPSDHIELGYFTSGAGDSGWRRYELGTTFADYTLRFTPGLPQGPASADYAGIWPSAEGQNQTVDVKAMRVRIVGSGAEDGAVQDTP